MPAAEVNMDLGLLAPEIATAIIRAADDVVDAKHDDQFPVDARRMAFRFVAIGSYLLLSFISADGALSGKDVNFYK